MILQFLPFERTAQPVVADGESGAASPTLTRWPAPPAGAFGNRLSLSGPHAPAARNTGSVPEMPRPARFAGALARTRS